MDLVDARTNGLKLSLKLYHVRELRLDYQQSIAEALGKDLKTEAVAGTEECAEAGEEADEKWNHEFGFIA